MYSFVFKQIENKYKKNTLIENYKKILILMTPVIPHFANECLLNLGSKDYKWPKVNSDLIKVVVVNIVIQVNGKKRGLIKTENNSTEEDLLEMIYKDDKIAKYIENSDIKKKVFLKNKLLNIII